MIVRGCSLFFYAKIAPAKHDHDAPEFSPVMRALKHFQSGQLFRFILKKRPAGELLFSGRPWTHPGLAMVGMSAKIEMKSWPAGGSGIAMAMIVAHRAAVMADDAITKDGMPVAIAANDDAFAIHRSAAGAAVVREAAAGVVAVKGLRTGRSENSQTGGNSNEGEEFFHDERRFAFDLLPHSNGVFMRRGAAARIRDSSNFFHRIRESPQRNSHEDLHLARLFGKAVRHASGTAQGASLHAASTPSI